METRYNWTEEEMEFFVYFFFLKIIKEKYMTTILDEKAKVNKETQT